MVMAGIQIFKIVGGFIMAFKILDNEELSLLSDSQQKKYEKELELYQQRVAFVEQLEMLENAHIEPYKPKLESISVIDEVEIRPFPKTEYDMFIYEPIEKPDLQIKLLKKPEQVRPVLPLISKPVNVSDKHIKKVKKTQPNLPLVMRPEVLVTSFKWSRKNHSNLPNITTPSGKMAVNFEKLKSNLHHTPNNIPDVVMPDMNINSVAIPTKTNPHLPDISVCTKEVITFVKPKKHDFDLPTMDRLNLDIKYKKEEKKIQSILPEVPIIFHMVKKFNIPKQQNADLPMVQKPDIDVQSFKKAEYDISTLPGLSKVELQVREFSKPEYSKFDLPMVSNAKVDIRHIQKPEKRKCDVPVVAKTTLVVRKFEKPEKIQPNIVTLSKPSVTVKTFKKHQSSASNLPVINITEAPDAYSELKEFFFMSSENTEEVKDKVYEK